MVNYNDPLFHVFTVFTISKYLLMVRFFIFLYSSKIYLAGALFYLFMLFTISKDLVMVRFFNFLYSIRFYLVRFLVKDKKAHH